MKYQMLPDLCAMLGYMGTLMYTHQKQVRDLERRIAYLDDGEYYSSKAFERDALYAEKWAHMMAMLVMGWKGPVSSYYWSAPSFWE